VTERECINFSDLPPELRIEIWKYALPVLTTTDIKRTSVSILATSLSCRKNKMPHIEINLEGSKSVAVSAEMRDVIALLRTCKLARDIALKAFQHVLPLGSQDLLHFDDHSTIHVHKFGKTLGKLLVKSLYLGLHVPQVSFFENIKNLSIGSGTF
jgi:hypothetical protein